MRFQNLRQHRLMQPAWLLPWLYLGGFTIGTILLSMPICAAQGYTTTVWEAAFTSMSAICITGLTVVNTGAHWSQTGQLIILGLAQIGGFGIMTFATMILFSIGKRNHYSSFHIARMAQTETRAPIVGIKTIPQRILAITIVIELAAAIPLTLRFLSLGYEPSKALYYGLYHAISAFNNAGLTLFPNNLESFNQDPFIMLPICAAVMAGGLGFPVYLELMRLARGTKIFWSIHLRLTLILTIFFFLLGYISFGVFEWANPATLGNESLSGKLLGALGGAIFPRSGGFNSVDYAAVSNPTLAVTSALMFIGGGCAGTAGGVKVTTVGVLLLTVATEISGEKSSIFHFRTISESVTRQALSIIVLSGTTVFLGILILISLDPISLRDGMVEVISAFGTVGLSTGITPGLSHSGFLVLMCLMFLGRIGPLTLAGLLAHHSRPRRYDLPEEDPLVG